MAFPLPPWLNVTPAFYTQALEAGARVGIAVTEQQQRAQQMAEARAERAAQQAERQREFEETRLLNVQRLGQQAAELVQLGDYRQQQARHQTAQEANQAAQESRLLNFQQGMLGVRQQEADQADKPVTPSLVDLGGGAKGVVMGKSYHPLPAPRAANTLDAATRKEIDLLSREKAAIDKEMSSGAWQAKAGLPEFKPELDAAKSRQEFIGKRLGELLPGAFPTTAPATGRLNPLPKMKADLVTDNFYDIKGTAYRWDGTNFKRVPTR